MTEMSNAHIAQFASTCPECGKTIKEGGLYRVIPDPEKFGEKAYVHNVCPPGPLRRPICPGCFMELPLTGVCGDCD